MARMNATYKVASWSSANEFWRPVKSVTSDYEMLGELDDIRSRCRDLVRNNAIAQAVMTTLLDYCASTGLSPMGDQGLMEIWDEWGQDCHISGRGTWGSNYRDIVGAQVETGDIVVYTPINPNAKGIKTRIDLIEGDRVRTPNKFQKNRDIYGNEVRHGVAYDAIGQEVGYWVAKIDPVTSGYRDGGADAYHYLEVSRNGRFNARLIRRPDKMRPAQSRQLPIFVSVASQLWDIDQFWDAAIARARSLSLIAAIIETDEPGTANKSFGVDQSAGAETYNNEAGQPVNVGQIPSGGLVTVPYGTKVSTVTPSGSMDIDALIVRSIRLLGAAIGIPYELIARDFSQTNFSSGKLGHDGFFRLVDRWNRGNAESLANHLFRLISVEASLLGDPRAAGLDANKLRVRWIGGPRSYNADPGRESSAEQTRMDNNLTTEEMLASEAGMDFKDILRSKARVFVAQREIEKEYDLPEGTLKRKESAAPVKAEETDPEEKKPEAKQGMEPENPEDNQDATDE